MTSRSAHLLAAACSLLWAASVGWLAAEAAPSVAQDAQPAAAAFVGDDGPYARAIDALDGLMPAALRRFAQGDLDRAKAWLAAG